MAIDNVHDLFKERLSRILTPVHDPRFGMFQLLADAVNENEEPLDALARHMCSALVEKKDGTSETGGCSDNQGDRLGNGSAG